MSDRPPRVVCDAGPLIHLDELNILELLTDFEEILVPEPVWREVIRHRPSALKRAGVLLSRVPITASPDSVFQSIVSSLSLDYGEQAALTLIQNYPDAIFLTDDAAARLAAIALGYKVHGTVGLIVRAIRRGQKTRGEVLELLRKLRTESTLHIRESLLKEVITRVENQSDSLD